MLRSAAVARIQQGLGFRSDQADAIVSALLEEQRDLEKGETLPEFMLREDQSLNLVAGTNSVALPTDFLRRAKTLIHYVPIYSTRSKDIPWRDFDEARNAYSRFDPHGPEVVAIRQSTLWFEPLPDQNYTLTWSYYRKADLLTSDIENLWLANAPELLIGGAGVRIAQDMRNQTAVQLFATMRQRAKDSVFKETVLDEADDVQVLGGNN